MKSVGIVMATSWEAGPVLKAFPFKKKESNLYVWERPEGNVWLAVSGVGQQAARKATDRLGRKGISRVISAGFCGALTSQNDIGDVVFDRIATVSTAAVTPEQRQAVAARANARVVDMETQAVIEGGTRQGIPIQIVRVVSDRWDDDLSPLLGKTGTFSPFAIALRLLNPAVWPLAKRLKDNSRVAHARLIEALRDALKPN